MLEPNYLSDFRCKARKCRTSCCTGWKIRLSSNDISMLSNCDAGPDLRRRIEKGIDLYGFITEDSRRCPLLDTDGLCSLRKECGLDPMPEPCKAFPLTERAFPENVRTATAACERIVELLWEDENPLSLNGSPDKPEKPTEKGLISARKTALALISNRLWSLDQRMKALLGFVEELSKAGACISPAAVRCAANALQVPLKTTVSFCSQDVIGFLKMIILPLASGKGSVHNDADTVLRSLVEAEISNSTTDLKIRSTFFSERFPKREIWFEKILANHILYTGFPYSGRFADLKLEAASLVSFYALMKLFSGILKPQSIDDLVDIIVRLSRAFEHGNADLVSARCFSSIGMQDYGLLYAAAVFL